MLRGLLGLALLGTGIGTGWALWQTTPNVAQVNSAPPAGATSAIQPLPLDQLAAADQALRAGQAARALELLRDRDSAELGDHILYLRALAYERGLNPVSAAAQWQALVERFPNSPLVPRALVGLNRDEEVIRRFPAHPVAVAPLQAALRRNPQNWSILEQLATHHPSTEGIVSRLDNWRSATGLSGAQWQVIADAYWTQREYGRASRAYANTPPTARNLYRLARSHQISREVPQAIAAYERLLAQFANDPLVPQARLFLADLQTPSLAIATLRTLADSDQPEAATALLRLVRLYEETHSPQAAQAAQAELWQRFSRSEAAATLAWERAWPLAETGDWAGAIAIVNPIFSAQADTAAGARLGFWQGKWQQNRGQLEQARQSWRRVFQDARNTYHGWRSADLLGLPVGDLRSGRRQLDISYTPAVMALPQGSQAVQLLHQGGMPELAWERWQWENPPQLNADTTDPATEMTAGVLRNRAGERLRGINQVARLLSHEDEAAVASLKARPDFWQTVYPLHHLETLVENTAKYNLNPLILASLIRQESRFEPEIESVAGALGLTQVLPSTGQWIAEQLGVPSFDLRDPEDNLYFGTWYLDYTHRRNQDNTLLAIASYNAGPGSVAGWVDRFGTADLDVFAERIPFAETHHYVSAVFGNYWNYLQIYVPEFALLTAPES